MADPWDIEYNEHNIMATGSQRGIYSEICDSLLLLKQLKFEPFQPLPYPREPDFIDRLKKWIKQFDDENQKYMLYLSSKIIFVTHQQMNYLMEHVFSKIIKIMLENIIFEKKLPPFSYKKAREFLASEFEKTLFVGLTDSSRINDFSHVNSDYIDRKINMGIQAETLLYPSRRCVESKKDLLQYSLTDKEVKLNNNWEREILSNDPLLLNKEWLVILEDFSGSGSDIETSLDYLENSYLPFKKIIFAPYIMTYKSKQTLDSWISLVKSKEYPSGKKYFYTYGTLISDEAQCFGFNKSYLKSEWHDNSIDICEKINNICRSTCETKFHSYKDSCEGFGGLKIAFVTYYNCPDNSLPIIWYFKDNWSPLFIRASRII